jgi:hypothetical protein
LPAKSPFVLAVLFVAGPFAIAWWPIPETSAAVRIWANVLMGVLLVPVGWTILFATAGALTLDVTSASGGAGSLPGHVEAAFAALITFVLAVMWPLKVLTLRPLLGMSSGAGGSSASTGSTMPGAERVRAAHARLRSRAFRRSAAAPDARPVRSEPQREARSVPLAAASLELRVEPESSPAQRSEPAAAAWPREPVGVPPARERGAACASACATPARSSRVRPVTPAPRWRRALGGGAGQRRAAARHAPPLLVRAVQAPALAAGPRASAARRQAAARRRPQDRSVRGAAPPRARGLRARAQEEDPRRAHREP